MLCAAAKLETRDEVQRQAERDVHPPVRACSRNCAEQGFAAVLPATVDDVNDYCARTCGVVSGGVSGPDFLVVRPVQRRPRGMVRTGDGSLWRVRFFLDGKTFYAKDWDESPLLAG